MSLDIGAPVLIPDAAVNDQVRIGCSVFGNEQRWHVVVAIQTQQQVGEVRRRDFPTHIGDCGAFAGRRKWASGNGNNRVVVIHSEKVQRFGNQLRVPFPLTWGTSAARYSRISTGYSPSEQCVAHVPRRNKQAVLSVDARSLSAGEVGC